MKIRLLCLITFLLLLAGTGHAAPGSLLDHAKSNLSEVLGYEGEDLKNFVFEDDARG